MAFAAFDVDGTLYGGHMYVGFARHHRQHRVGRVSLLLYLASHIAMWPLYRLGLVSELVARESWLRDMAYLVRDWPVERADEAFRWIAREYVLPTLRVDVMQRLRAHQAAGDRVILVSGTLTPLLQAVGDALGVQEVVGTRPVIANGRYTGATHPPTCQGEGKPALLAERLGTAAPDLWQASYAYADSETDLPLLERVGHPVAVSPDKRLAALARERGWEVLG